MDIIETNEELATAMFRLVIRVDAGLSDDDIRRALESAIKMAEWL